MNIKIFTAIMICFLLILEVSARAGGGGGGGGGGGSSCPEGGYWPLICLALYPLMFVYSAIVSFMLVRKNKQARSAIKQLEYESNWNLKDMKSRIEICFMRVQEARELRDQNHAVNHMSPKLFKKHKKLTDSLKRKGHINKLDGMRLTKSRIVEVKDFYGKGKDYFWVAVQGLSKDYTINETTNKLIDGEKKLSSFQELWRFVYDEDKGWVVDEIDSKIGFIDLLTKRSKIEK